MKKLLLSLLVISLAISSLSAKPKKSKKKAVVEPEQTEETTTLPGYPEGYEEPAFPEGDIFEIDNFEQSLYWEESNWEGFLDTECQLYSKWASRGNCSLKLEYATSKNEKMEAAFLCKNLLETDLTGAKYLILDVNNPNKECMYISAGAQCWNKIEEAGTSKKELITNKTSEYPCPPGQHFMVFDLKDFKNIEDVYSLIIYANTSTTLNGKTAAFYIDNVRIVFDYY